MNNPGYRLSFSYLSPGEKSAAPDDRCLRHLLNLTGLKVLDLNNTNVTPEGLKLIRNLKSLESFTTPAATTDAGMAHVSNLRSLKALHFGENKVTSAGLAHLANLSSLEELGLLGSIMYAEECQAEGKNIAGVINMDMIIHPRNDAQPGLPLDVDIITDGPSRKLADIVQLSIETYTTLDTQVTVNTVHGSDHAPFWNIGARAVALTENTPDEIYGGSTTVYHTTSDLITQPNVDLPFGLSVARGVAVAAMKLAVWEPSSAIPFGTTTYADVDGVAHFDSGEHEASIAVIEDSAPFRDVVQCRTGNLVLQGAVNARSSGPNRTVCCLRSFQTFVPRSTTFPDGEEVVVELNLRGSGDFVIDGKPRGLYADSRAEVWARSIESLRLFTGSVSLSSAGTEIGGDFSPYDFTLQSTTTRKEAILSEWTHTIPFTVKVGQPMTLCAQLNQMAYAKDSGQTECTWTEPLQLSVASTNPDVSLEMAGFSEQPQVAQISTDGTHVALNWQPFSQGLYTIEQSQDLVSWTPVATTPFTTWETSDPLSRCGFFRLSAE